MSKNLKDLIDGVEEEEKTRSRLEKKIELLIAENNKLHKRIDELKPKFEIKSISEKVETEESKEIQILKNMISTQKKEIDEKHEKISHLKSKIEELDSYINDLKEKVENSQESKQLQETQTSMENLLNEYDRIENLNVKLAQKIEELEREKSQYIQKSRNELNDLQNLITEFEKENKTLRTELLDFSSVQEEFLRLREEYESVLSKNLNLESEIKSLKEQKQKIQEKDTILLAKTITAMKVKDKPKLEPSNDNAIKIPKEIPHEQIAEFNKFTKEEKLPTPQEVVLPEPNKNINQLIAEEITNGNGQEIIKRKWECPNCGNTNKAQIREVPDKTRIIYAGPGGNMYAKKYKCGICAQEWH